MSPCRADLGDAAMGLVSALMGLVPVYLGLRILRDAFIMRRMPVSRVCSIKDGPAKVYGVVSPANGTLISPLTKKNCVYYRLSISESKRGSDNYTIVKSDRGMLCFYIDDGTGRLLINPERADIDLSADYKFQSGVFRDPPDDALRLLSENKIKHDGFMGLNKGMKFTEY
jgi:hypothetical protein